MVYKRGKLTKYRLLARSSELAAALPPTRTLNKENLSTYLSRYKSVILKPSFGSGGAGVIAVSTKDHHTYRVHSGRSVVYRTGMDSLYSAIRKKTRGRLYLVQRKLSLAKVGGRPFDIRVMVQRKRGEWIVSGRLAKAAGAGYIITNLRLGRARVLPLRTALRRSNISGLDADELIHRIDRLSLRSVHQLNRYYRLRNVGLDISVDTQGRLWLIEPNFHPDLTMFRRLKDKSIYRRIRALSGRKK